jgi:AraC-like DNA-binding protein
MSVKPALPATGRAAEPAGGRVTVIAGYAIAIARALEHKGVDSRRVFRAAGISELVSNDPLDRLPEATTAALYKISVDVTQDPYFGLTVAKFIHASNIHAVGYALLASKTLLDFCLRLERYFALVSQSAMLRTERSSTEVALRFRHVTLICGENEDACLAFVLRFMRLLYRSEFRPLRVEFHHACPAEGAGPYEECFGVRPDFDQAETALVFPAPAMDDPLPGACPELAQLNDKIAGDYLARLDKSDVTARVRAKIVELLSSDDCSRRRVAREVCMSEATLHQKLAQRNTSFHDLLNDTRREMALGYLSQRALSVTEIAFLLGFTDTSNFTRAFKRWTGTSPTLYRSGVLGQPA